MHKRLMTCAHRHNLAKAEFEFGSDCWTSPMWLIPGPRRSKGYQVLKLFTILLRGQCYQATNCNLGLEIPAWETHSLLWGLLYLHLCRKTCPPHSSPFTLWPWSRTSPASLTHVHLEENQLLSTSRWALLITRNWNNSSLPPKSAYFLQPQAF